MALIIVRNSDALVDDKADDGSMNISSLSPMPWHRSLESAGVGEDFSENAKSTLKR